MFWVVQVVIVSIVIIFLLHNLYIFFKETLTVPKMKDMVKRPQQKYESLFRELEEFRRDHNVNVSSTNATNANASNANANANATNANASTNVSNANDANDAMKNELKRYLMELNAPQSNSDFIEMGSVYQ
jgi:hypothetical protein